MAAHPQARRDTPHTHMFTRVCTHSPAQEPHGFAPTHSRTMHHTLVHSRTRTTAPRAPARSVAVAVLHRCPQEDARPCVHSLSLAHAGSQPRTSAITHISAPKRMRTAVPSCALCTCPRAPVLARACAQRSRDMVAGPLSRSLWRLCAITRACVGPPPPPLAGPSGFRVRPPASAAPAVTSDFPLFRPLRAFLRS